MIPDSEPYLRCQLGRESDGLTFLMDLNEEVTSLGYNSDSNSRKCVKEASFHQKSVKDAFKIESFVSKLHWKDASITPDSDLFLAPKWSIFFNLLAPTPSKRAQDSEGSNAYIHPKTFGTRLYL